MRLNTVKECVQHVHVVNVCQLAKICFKYCLLFIINNFCYYRESVVTKLGVVNGL